MNWKRHIIEAATLVVAALVCALTANALASRERKLAVAPSESFAAPPPSARPASGERPAPSGTQIATPAETPAETPPQPATATVAPPVATTTTAAAAHVKTPKPAPAVAPKAVATPSKSIADFKPHPDKAYVEIGFADVNALHESGVLFLDARRTSVYEQGHIAGARPFSVWESDVDEKVNKLFAERGDPREQEKPIVIYCSGGDCEDSHMLAQKLWGIQFNNIYVYKDGFPDWQKKGGSVHTGGKP